MKTIMSTIIEKLNRMESFSLRYDGGSKVLWELSAPGLHVLTLAHQFINFAGDRGRAALHHHAASGDFFNKTYDILGKAGLTREFAPDVWGYIRELNRFATISRDIEIKASANVQLFRFLQELLETIIFNEFLERTGREVEENADIFKKLVAAADSFVVRNADGSIQMMAGYPWFIQDWTRDTFISFDGILLVTERFEYAKSLFTYYARHQGRDGLLPNRIMSPWKKDYNTADGSLWFIEALNRYRRAARTKDADAFVKRMLPAVNRIMDGYLKPSGEIHLDKDNLVVVPAQWTWMDAAPSGAPVTPRNGKPVEIQALFYNALSIAGEFNYLAGNRTLAGRYDALKNQVGRSVVERYFDYGRRYPFDVIDGDEHGGAVRPNGIFLLSLSSVDGLIPKDLRDSMLEIIERELLTPYGLRSLSTGDARYRGDYDTFAPMEVKDRSYHQGTVWPFFMSHYITAKVRQMKESCDAETIAEFIRSRVRNLMYLVKDKDTLPELFAGDEPHRPGGAVSQAWSVAALLEIVNLLNREYGAKRLKKGKK